MLQVFVNLSWSFCGRYDLFSIPFLITNADVIHVVTEVAAWAAVISLVGTTNPPPDPDGGNTDKHPNHIKIHTVHNPTMNLR